MSLDKPITSVGKSSEIHERLVFLPQATQTLNYYQEESAVPNGIHYNSGPVAEDNTGNRSGVTLQSQQEISRFLKS